MTIFGRYICLYYLAQKLRDMTKKGLEKECWNHFYIHNDVFNYLLGKLSELNLLDDLKLEASKNGGDEDVRIATENIIKAIELYKKA